MPKRPRSPHYRSQPVIAVADEAADDARALREDLRRRSKPGAEQREDRIAVALAVIIAAMVPVRSELGRAAYGRLAPAYETELRRASRALQLERKKLVKMQREPNNAALSGWKE